MSAAVTEVQTTLKSEGSPLPQKGHPRGLYLLFFTEMWERLSYYGMRVLLMPYMVTYLLWQPSDASGVHKWYTSLVYLTPLLGGFLADRFIGLRRSIIIGGSLMAMSWGHWYLTNSGLPKEPLEQMSLLVVGALGLQLVLLVVGVIAPVREVPLTESAFGVSLGANPAFWLRVAVGLLFPLFLSVLAWKAASIRGMMSATGLLYIATGAVLAGEVLARGLLFATGITL